MKRKISRISTFELNEEDHVCVIKTGMITQIRYMSGHNHDTHIKRIDKDHYIDVKSHEIRTYKKHDHTLRTDNDISLRRSFRTAKQIINANFKDRKLTTWLTLTYTWPVCDDKQIQKDFSSFMKTLRRKNKGNDVKYFIALEFGANNGIHIHCILFWQYEIQEYMYDIIRTIWKHGSVCIRSLKDNADICNLGAYLTAYLRDMPIEEYKEAFPYRGIPPKLIKSIYTSDSDGELKQYIKNARMKLYRSGFKLFRHSIGMEKAVKEYGNYESAMKEITAEKKKCIHKNTINVTDDDGLNLVIQYETYQ